MKGRGKGEGGGKKREEGVKGKGSGRRKEEEGEGIVAGGAGGWVVTDSAHFWIGAECPNVDLSSRHGLYWVHYNGHPRFLVLLVQHLGAHVNAREPAAIAGVTVVPTNGILHVSHLHTHTHTRTHT